jgi:hypothetical protein
MPYLCGRCVRQTLVPLDPYVATPSEVAFYRGPQSELFCDRCALSVRRNDLDPNFVGAHEDFDLQ